MSAHERNGLDVLLARLLDEEADADKRKNWHDLVRRLRERAENDARNTLVEHTYPEQVDNVCIGVAGEPEQEALATWMEAHHPEWTCEFPDHETLLVDFDEPQAPDTVEELIDAVRAQFRSSTFSYTVEWHERHCREERIEPGPILDKDGM